MSNLSGVGSVSGKVLTEGLVSVNSSVPEYSNEWSDMVITGGIACVNSSFPEKLVGIVESFSSGPRERPSLQC